MNQSTGKLVVRPEEVASEMKSHGTWASAPEYMLNIVFAAKNYRAQA